MSEHPALAELAEFAEPEDGTQTPTGQPPTGQPPTAGEEHTAAEEQVRTHLAGCAGCRAALADIADVRGQLRGLATVALPPDVAARLQMALADEAARPTQPHTADRPAGSAGSRIHRRRWRPQPGLVAASVVALLVLVIGGGALANRASNHTGSSSADRSASRVTGSAQGQATAGTVFAASGRDYSPATVDGDVRRLLTGQPAATADSRPSSSAAAPNLVVPGRSGGSSNGADPLARLRRPAALAACVRTLTGGRAATPLAVDYAAYQGTPAVVVVLPGTHVRIVLVYVAAASCGPQHPELLYYHQTNR